MGDIVIFDKKGKELRITHADFRENGIDFHDTGVDDWLRSITIPLSRELDHARLGGVSPSMYVTHPKDPSISNQIRGDHFAIYHNRERYLGDIPAGETVSKCGEEKFVKLPDGTQLYIRHEADNEVANGECKASLLIE